jgi:multidrug resistance efflux pump
MVILITSRAPNLCGPENLARPLESRAADFTRARRLLERGVISQSEFDRAEEVARVAEAVHRPR